MAVTAIWDIKGRVDKVINYVRNPSKVTEKAYENMLKLEKQQLSNEEKAKRATYVLKSSENEDLNLKQLNDIIYVIRQK